MSYTASHYHEVAQIIREIKAGRYTDAMPNAQSYADGVVHGLNIAQERIAAMFARHNPKFDAERFARDCQPKQERSAP